MHEGSGPRIDEVVAIGQALGITRDGRTMGNYAKQVISELGKRCESSEFVRANKGLLQWWRKYRLFEGDAAGTLNKDPKEPKDGYSKLLLWSLIASYCKDHGMFEAGPVVQQRRSRKPKRRTRRNADGKEGCKSL
jgi:hypothetical protein